MRRVPMRLRWRLIDAVHLNKIELLRRYFLSHLFVNVQVCVQHFAGDPPEPLVEGNIHELVSREQLKDNKIGITRIFEVVRCVGGNVSDIVGVVVHCAGIIDRKRIRSCGPCRRSSTATRRRAGASASHACAQA
jgi:hypothetical protein